MQEEIAPTGGTGTQSGGRRFIDTLIGQWVNRTGSNISMQQAEEQVAESSNAEDRKRQVSNQAEHLIQKLKQKLKESQDAEAYLSTSLEMEMRNKEEIHMKLNATWVYIDNITEYLNYIKETLDTFQQHRISLSTIYDNVILKQQVTIQNLQLNDTKSKDLEIHVVQLMNKLSLQGERLQEATAEQNKLRKQLENSEYELQLQRDAHAEEKLTLVKEQQRLSLEYENLQARLQMIEKEKCDIAKSAVLLEKKLLLQEEKMQEMLTEQNKLKKQAENAEYKFNLQKNELARTHAEEKKMLIEKQLQMQLEYESLQSQLNTLEQDKSNITEIIAQKDTLISKKEEKMQEMLKEQNKLKKQAEDAEHKYNSQKNELARIHAEEKEMLIKKQLQMQLECESLQSRLNTLEQDKSNITEIIAQKDTLISKLQNEISMYKNENDTIMARYNETSTEHEALTQKQNIREKELLTKMERIRHLEMMLHTMKQREASLINDVNRMEKKLTNEMDYSKNLENKFSNVQRDLQLAQKENVEMQKTLEKTKSTNEFANIEFQQQLKALQKEKDEVIKRENTKVKNSETLYENTRTKHVEEVSALKNNYEIQLAESKKIVDHLNEMMNNIKRENSVLNKSLMEIRAEKATLQNNCEFIQAKLKEATEMTQIKSIDDRKLTSEFKKPQFNVSTSVILNDNNENNKSLSQPLSRVSSTKRQSQNEQEAEITSVGKKFFKFRSGQQRTYTTKRRKD